MTLRLCPDWRPFEEPRPRLYFTRYFLYHLVRHPRGFWRTFPRWALVTRLGRQWERWEA